MRKTSFIDCTSYFGSFTGVTGSIRGIYDFNSGSASGIIYNLIYPTGSHFQSGNIYSPIIPLISVGKNTISGYTFTGVNNYRFGYTQSGDFAILADMEYSGCSKTTTGVGNVFISTADSPTGISGTFFIGINDANRLFFGTSGQYNQLDYELKTHNLVYVSMAGQKHVNYGIFDYLNQTYKGNSVTLTNNQSLVNKIYIGGFLNNTDTNYTGFFGKVNDAVFFDQHIPLDDISSCSNCLFVTGQSGTANVGNYTVPAITGYVLSGISGQIVTGSILVTGQVFNYSGGLINVVFDSGIWANIQTGQITLLLTGTTIVSVTGRDIVTFYNDNTKVNNFDIYDIEFITPLVSGDVVEIYGHNSFNPYVNFDITNLFYPESDKFVQLIGNGLVETKDVDYQVVHNLISGFFNDDELDYDLYSGVSAIMAYSGFWPRARITLSGNVYYPTTGQFGERSGTMVASGIADKPISNRGNFYLNGQKLISGVHYNIKDDLAFNYYGLSGYVVEFYPSGSGIFADFIADVIYASNGSGTGIGEVQDSELTMLDVWTNDYNRYLSVPTGNVSVIGPITGFSEQVWINGIRQTLNDTYVKNFTCELNSGSVDLPSTPLFFYQNEGTFFNMEG